MRCFALDHLSDPDLRCRFATAVTRESQATASVLAHLAEFDARRLFLPAGYDTMTAYCMEELRWSPDVTAKRLQAARKAREVPALFEALADGRLHLSGIGLLAPHLTRENAVGLIGAAAGRTHAEIRRMLAERFPRSEHLALVEQLPSGTPSPGEHATQHVCANGDPAPAGGEPTPGSRVEPHAPQRFALHLVIDQETHDELQYLRALLGHQVPSGDLAQVIGRAVKGQIAAIEKRKFGVTARPRPSRSRSLKRPGTIPVAVRRAVLERDGGRCAFVGENGHRCESRRQLEFDHIVPIGRGGESTVENVRMACRAHNQHAADQVYGAGFMAAKREEARRKAKARAKERAAEEEARLKAEADARERVTEEEAPRKARAGSGEQEGVTAAETRRTAEAAARERAEIAEQTQDLIVCLRNLRVRTDEIRRATEHCAAIPFASLEERVRAALRFLGRRHRAHTVPPMNVVGA